MESKRGKLVNQTRKEESHEPLSDSEKKSLEKRAKALLVQSLNLDTKYEALSQEKPNILMAYIHTNWVSYPKIQQGEISMKTNTVLALLILSVSILVVNTNTLYACDSQEQAVRDAQDEVDIADDDYREKRRAYINNSILGPLVTPSTNMGLYNDIRNDYEASIITSAYLGAERVLNEKKEALKKAQEALDACNQQYNRCPAPACDQVPAHSKMTMSGCGHSDYFCRRGRHDTRSCPKNANGDKCITNGGLYLTCKEHTHKYPDAVGPCGHRYDPSSSAAYNHRSENYPCGNHSYYVCHSQSGYDRWTHGYGTLPCGNHTGSPCTADSSHTAYTTCPKHKGRKCDVGKTYRCSPHRHTYTGDRHTYTGGNPEAQI